ncbi:MerR family transcriptional regulator [Streptomyces sp. HNM0574]|nr:MerR family transcriptional regulator [Streptomyces sp. HNM0574]
MCEATPAAGPGAPDDGTWSIGEVARRAGVTVKTVRFYSDRGLLPEAGRSTGGHRRYGPEALERLRRIRSLRTLDLPVPQVARALDEEAALDEAIEGRLRELNGQLAALRWREAALHLLRDGTVEERAERLALIGAMGTPPTTDAMAYFWRCALPVRLPRRIVTPILEAAVPQLPADPGPEQVLTFARLHAVVTDRAVCTEHTRSVSRQPAGTGTRPEPLFEGLLQAYALAEPDLRAGRAPRAGEALDCFVAAYARARGTQDTPEFRHRLGELLRWATVPAMERYWELFGELAPGSGELEPTYGAAQEWLRGALDAACADGVTG